MHIITKLTAAVALAGGLSIATSVRAEQHCDFSALVLREALSMRTAGLGLDDAMALRHFMIERASAASGVTGSAADIMAGYVIGEAFSFAIGPEIIQAMGAAGVVDFAVDSFVEGCEGDPA